jgi:hypothetical protein
MGPEGQPKPSQARRHESLETPSGEFHARLGQVAALFLADKNGEDSAVQSDILAGLDARSKATEDSVRKYVARLPVVPAQILAELLVFLKGQDLEAGSWGFSPGWKVRIRVRSAEDEAYLARLALGHDENIRYSASALLVVGHDRGPHRFPRDFYDRLALRPIGGTRAESILSCCPDPQVMFFANLSSAVTYHWTA